MANLQVGGQPLLAALVDLDGTLVDTLGDFQVTLNRMLVELGLPEVGRAEVETRVGKGSEHLVRQTLALALAAAEAERLFDTALAAYQRHYAEVNGQHATVFPGVLEGLQQLREQGLRLACITNKPTGFARALLQQKGLLPYFALVVGGDAFARKKPDPLPLLESCRLLAVAPARSLMIGDSQNDAQAAAGAACPVALATYGYNHGEPIRATPALAYFDRLDQLQLPG